MGLSKLQSQNTDWQPQCRC